MIKNAIRGRIKSLLFILPLNLIIYSIYQHRLLIGSVS